MIHGIILISSLLIVSSVMAKPHPDFVSIEDMCPQIIVHSSYATVDNFTGAMVDGYKKQKAFLAKSTALALCKVQKKAEQKGFVLKIFDAYRPVKAVNFFQEWAKSAETDEKIKKKYYPTFSRQELFEKGYIAAKSSHSRGSAVDLTLYNPKTKQDIDMGGIFDFFDEISTTETNLITKEQQKNRLLLRDLMSSEGFSNYSGEWWHFSLKPEPYPYEYFDFDVE